MNQATPIKSRQISILTRLRAFPYLKMLIAGLFLTLSFAPFHKPGLAILSLSLLYNELRQVLVSPFKLGFVFGLSYFGFSVSWVVVSIHEYGHLNFVLASLITTLFVIYLSLFTALSALISSKLQSKNAFFSALIFSAAWVIGEFLRSQMLSGFPWVILGFSQIDSPIRHVLPFIGVYGASFVTALASAWLAESFTSNAIKRIVYLFAFIATISLPYFLQHIHFIQLDNKEISVGIIQANLSMRDKWDEHLFWNILDNYEQKTNDLLGTDLIVMPESAIPLPANYVNDYLLEMHQKAEKAGSAVLLGIPKSTEEDETAYYNGLIGMGKAVGHYHKQHLVPFGEYTPFWLKTVLDWLGIPDANMRAGDRNQQQIKVKNRPIATLICYELAYAELLRTQLPNAQWIVSISDDGWFGHSLALYQHIQMAQALSLETGRYQILANNDGLSTLINHQGDIIASLPAFSAGILKTRLYPAQGSTLWVTFGDVPSLLLSLGLLFLGTWFYIQNKHL